MNDFNRGALQVPCLRLDYGFGEQLASVELGDGTGYVRLADYEKLRAERDYLLMNSNPTATELRRVRSAWKKDRDENSKLRELVRAFDWCTENFDTPNKCDGCPLPQRDALNPECELIMRELGVRLDG